MLVIIQPGCKRQASVVEPPGQEKNQKQRGAEDRGIDCHRKRGAKPGAASCLRDSYPPPSDQADKGGEDEHIHYRERNGIRYKSQRRLNQRINAVRIESFDPGGWELEEREQSGRDNRECLDDGGFLES